MSGASKSDISHWFDCGVKEGATHMIVVCDTYDYDDYSVYVMPGESPKKKVEKYSGKNMQTVMEVYDLSKDKEEQLNEHRVYNYDKDEPWKAEKGEIVACWMDAWGEKDRVVIGECINPETNACLIGSDVFTYDCMAMIDIYWKPDSVHLSVEYWKQKTEVHSVKKEKS